VVAHSLKQADQFYVYGRESAPTFAGEFRPAKVLADFHTQSPMNKYTMPKYVTPAMIAADTAQTK
jgi:hypothetical protein